MYSLMKVQVVFDDPGRRTSNFNIDCQRLERYFVQCTRSERAYEPSYLTNKPATGTNALGVSARNSAVYQTVSASLGIWCHLCCILNSTKPKATLSAHLPYRLDKIRASCWSTTYPATIMLFLAFTMITSLLYPLTDNVAVAISMLFLLLVLVVLRCSVLGRGERMEGDDCAWVSMRRPNIGTWMTRRKEEATPSSGERRAVPT